MAVPAGKHLQFEFLRFEFRPGHHPHRSDWGNGRAARDGPADRWGSGRLRELSSLRTEACPRSGGGDEASPWRRFEFEEGPSGGWYFLV